MYRNKERKILPPTFTSTAKSLDVITITAGNYDMPVLPYNLSSFSHLDKQKTRNWLNNNDQCPCEVSNKCPILINTLHHQTPLCSIKSQLDMIHCKFVKVLSHTNLLKSKFFNQLTGKKNFILNNLIRKIIIIQINILNTDIV